MKEGDNNSRYFHNLLKARQRWKNIIDVKNKIGEVVKFVEEVKDAVKNNFEDRFKSSGLPRPQIRNLSFQQLPNLEAEDLEVDFAEEEIKGVVFDGDRDKSPGPDRFSLEFFRNCWDIVGGEVVAFIQKFHRGDRLPKVVNAAFLILIPQCDYP